MERDLIFSKLLQNYLKKMDYEICFSESDNCSKPIIKAHTIQNSFVLGEIAVSGHVSMICDDVDNLSFKKIGRNKAATFTGFCGFHDGDIFSSIDFNRQSIIKKLNDEQMTLFYYRALCREYWIKLNQQKSLEKLLRCFQDRDEKTLISIFPILKKESSIDWNFINVKRLRLFYKGTLNAISGIKLNYESLKNQISNKKFHLTKNTHIIIPKPARFAVGAAASPSFDFDGNQTNSFPTKNPNLLGFNLFSDRENTHIILSWHKRIDAVFNRLVGQLKAMQDDKKEIALSKFILTCIETITFSPDFVSELSGKKREKIQDIFFKTDHKNIPFKLSEYEDVNLF